MEKEEFCPTRGGTFIGYHPEYRIEGDDGWTGWRDMTIKKVEKEGGLPYPLLSRGILDAIDLYGLAQAKAFAWGFLTKRESEAGSEIYQVRVQAYEISYDIKAKKTGEPKPENETEHLE